MFAGDLRRLERAAPTNSLSVSVSHAVDWLTLRFGFHVEHHLFPTMASRHFPALRDLVRAHWPERYQSLPFVEALARLHRTVRLYKDDTTLIAHRTGREWPTLLPGLAGRSAPPKDRPGPSVDVNRPPSAPGTARA
jgi:fatty acid desaturase